jgi:hypothetical protein
MFNLIEFTLKTDDGERLLFISPVLLQSMAIPLLVLPGKLYVYENLITEDWLAYLRDQKINPPDGPESQQLAIKHVQHFEKCYLGYLIFSDENKWKWQDSTANISKDHIKKIEAFLNNS